MSLDTGLVWCLQHSCLNPLTTHAAKSLVGIIFWVQHCYTNKGWGLGVIKVRTAVLSLANKNIFVKQMLLKQVHFVNRIAVVLLFSTLVATELRRHIKDCLIKKRLLTALCDIVSYRAHLEIMSFVVKWVFATYQAKRTQCWLKYPNRRLNEHTPGLYLPYKPYLTGLHFA